MFGSKRRDELIDLLRDERDHLRARVADLERQLLAVTSPAAHRLLNPEPPTVSQAPVDAVVARTTTYRPAVRLSELMRAEAEGD